MKQKLMWSRSLIAAVVVGSLATFLAASAYAADTTSKSASSASPAVSTSAAPVATVGYKPAINALVDVVTPEGLPRHYPSAKGPMIWSAGSGQPIQKGDTVKLSVFVATGSYELKQVKVRLDNVLLASVDKQPWNVVLDTAKLDLGYHQFEIWAQSDSPAPSSSSESTIMFYVGAALYSSTATAPTKDPGATGSAVGVSNPIVATTPVVAGDALPVALRGLPQHPSATIRLATEDSTVDPTGKVILNKPATIHIIPGKISSVVRFVYAVYRDGSISFETTVPAAVKNTDIVLRALTIDQPGLAPGDIVLKVWGLDISGGFGPAQSLLVNIPSSAVQENIK